MNGMFTIKLFSVFTHNENKYYCDQKDTMLKRQSNSSLSKRTHDALISKVVPEMSFESTEILSPLK